MPEYQAPANYVHLDRVADQARDRRGVRLEDQFGRWWGTSIEKSTGDPCCGISPFGGWEDPLNTPNAYLLVPKHDDGMPIPGKIRVAFPEWIASIKGSQDDWDKLIEVAGRIEYKNYTPADRAEWAEDPILLRHAGPKPYPTVEMLEKAMGGDRVLLGLDYNVNPGMAQAADMTYREFVQDVMTDGKSMAAANRLWKEHRAFLEEDEIGEIELPNLEPEVEEEVTVG